MQCNTAAAAINTQEREKHVRDQDRSSLDGVGQEHQIRCSRHQGVARWHCSEAQEHKGPHQRSSIAPRLFEAHYDMTASESFFSVLQKSNKTLFRSIRKDTIGDLHKEFPIHKHSLPLDLNTVCQPHIEAQVRGCLCAYQGW